MDFDPDVGIEEVAVWGAWQTLGQEEEGAHQILNFPLVTSDKLGQVCSGIVDGLCLVLNALLRQIDELQPVQLKLQR